MSTLRSLPFALLIALFTASASAEPAKVGFIYIGNGENNLWTRQHELAREALQAELGSAVTVVTVPNTAEGLDGERAARKLSKSGAKMIYAVGLGYMDGILRVAADFPLTCYATATAYISAANVGAYTARWHEAGYLAGIVAGGTTKSHVIGFVAAHPTPETVWYVRAFTQGALSVDPVAQVRTIYVNAWSNSRAETDAANALMRDGADVLAHYTGTPATVAAAENQGVASISFHSDLRWYAPNNYLTGVLHNWGAYYTRTTRDALADKCNRELFVGGLADGTLTLAPYGPRVSPSTVDAVAKARQEIVTGRLRIDTRVRP